MQIVPLNKNIHNRTNFDCGNDALNNYLKTVSGQHDTKNLARTFVLTSEQDIANIKGFYSLALCLVELDELPRKISQKYPNSLHCALLGKLAISKQYQRQGLGSILLVDAVRKSIESSKKIPTPMIIIDTKNEIAKIMYMGLGFSSFPKNQSRLFMTMANAQAMINKIDTE